MCPEVRGRSISFSRIQVLSVVCSRKSTLSARSGSRSERTLDAVEHSRTLMEWWPFLIFHRGGLRIKVINNRRYLCSQRLHARNISQAQEHSEISSQGCFESLDGAQLKSESERYGTHYLFHTQLRLAYQSAHFFEHRPKSYFTQRLHAEASLPRIDFLPPSRF